MPADIVKIISRPNRYFWGDRQFEMPELKLLIDADPGAGKGSRGGYGDGEAYAEVKILLR